MGKIVFITGTDTGVGKTLCTGLLLTYLRRQGCAARALKPFCSGPRDDAETLASLQDGDLSLDEVNPWYFPQPLSPLAAAREAGVTLELDEVVATILRHSEECPVLLVEGAGGLLVPAGSYWTLADLAARLNSHTIVVAANRLGVLNHTLLTVEHLRHQGIQDHQVVLMGMEQSDKSVPTNAGILREFLGNTPLTAIPYLGKEASHPSAIRSAEKKLEKELEGMVGIGRFCAPR